MVEMAGVYGDALTLTCILNEGTVTVSSGTLVETGKMGTPTYALGTELKEGDFVSLSGETFYSYADCGGLPVMEAANATDGWIGIIKSQPVWNKIPSATRAWNTAAVTNATYRVASVVFPGLTMAFKALADGNSTAIEVGCPMKWSAGGDAFIDAGTTVTGVFSCHYTNAADTSVLIMCGGIGATPLVNTDRTGYLGAA